MNNIGTKSRIINNRESVGLGTVMNNTGTKFQAIYLECR